MANKSISHFKALLSFNRTLTYPRATRGFRFSHKVRNKIGFISPLQWCAVFCSMCKTFGFYGQLFMVCNVITWYSYKGNSECIVKNINGPGSWSLVPGSWSLVLGPGPRSCLKVLGPCFPVCQEYVVSYCFKRIFARIMQITQALS